MNLNFLFNGRNIEVNCIQGDVIKLYDVPKKYKKDGFFVAKWRYGEIEPLPACLGADTNLLADIAVQEEQNNSELYSGYLAMGVEIQGKVETETV